MIDLEKIYKIAQEAHAGQFRRDGKTPYMTHIDAVMHRVTSDEEMAVAALHDVLEEADDITVECLYLNVDSHIVDAVILLTKMKGQSYQDYLKGVKSNELAKTVKIADMLSNLADDPTERQIKKYAKGLLFLLDE